MSMIATFVQVEAEELAGLQADPSGAEALFRAAHAGGGTSPAQLAQAIERQLRAAGPQALADALARLPPAARAQLEARSGLTAEQLSGSDGVAALLQAMQARMTAAAATPAPVARRVVLSLDKDWHGVHYLLCGSAEPGTSLPSQAVLGGTALGEDDEGFSGYGPARGFTPVEVAALAAALGRAELEAEAAARFDAGRMTESTSIRAGPMRMARR